MMSNKDRIEDTGSKNQNASSKKLRNKKKEPHTRTKNQAPKNKKQETRTVAVASILLVGLSILLSPKCNCQHILESRNWFCLELFL